MTTGGEVVERVAVGGDEYPAARAGRGRDLEVVCPAWPT
jgi:hypothetical protein